MLRRLLPALLLVLLALPALAVQPDEMLADPALEARARALSAELRCMVCQNESIDDSDAPLAKDLRLLVRDRIRAGESDAAVKAFLVSRYGDFILLKPPLEWRTVALWTAPFLLLLAGGAGIVIAARTRRPSTPEGLTEAERASVEEILKRQE
ncbi:cytochrome c-type biogenesis protein [Labrys monachus]|uniref:Cytochrome c-type biogenesis protein n=1 Tax=Labrys monachus TaxID=217067 RepID=A0ABU0FIU9_9HYPH|nr:cytochrome c-type biogenesis protein [Labrys monachus]MDQ0394538.1 cytochrome c-type biogenesis protein CcmH [Labrys monachus]